MRALPRPWTCVLAALSVSACAEADFVVRIKREGNQALVNRYLCDPTGSTCKEPYPIFNKVLANLESRVGVDFNDHVDDVEDLLLRFVIGEAGRTHCDELVVPVKRVREVAISVPAQDA